MPSLPVSACFVDAVMRQPPLLLPSHYRRRMRPLDHEFRFPFLLSLFQLFIYHYLFLIN